MDVETTKGRWKIFIGIYILQLHIVIFAKFQFRLLLDFYESSNAHVNKIQTS